MDEELRNRFKVTGHDYDTPPARIHSTSPQPKPSVPPARPTHHFKAQPMQSDVSRPMFPMASYQPAAPTAAHHHSPPRPFETPPAKAVHHRQVKTRRRPYRLIKMLVILAFIGALVAGGKLWAYPKFFNTNPFSPAIRSSAQFTLFYPQKLPAGYMVDPNSINYANGQLTYNAQTGSTKIVFTIQKAPVGLNYASFYKQQLTAPQYYTTPYGQGVIGVNDKRQLGSLVADGTWILLSTNSSNVTRDEISLVMNNLKKY